jgi:hypothetical protein
MITKYDGFILERLKFEIFSLLEGHIYATTDFVLKMKSLSNQSGKVGIIATQILDIIESQQWFADSKIKQNYFDLVDSEDMVGFVNQSKVKTVMNDVYDNPELPFTMAGRGEVKIGKIVNYICSLRNISVTDSEREEFVNAWKASTDISTIQFKLVSGADIVKYYNEDNYYSKSGTLGSSCMRDEGARIFKIYTENPKKVKLLIYVDGDDKVHGRALVWKVKKSPCDSRYFMDRIYTNRDSDVNRFKKFADTEGWFYKKVMNSHVEENVLFSYKGADIAGEVVVKLDGDFNSYPFIDTMCFLGKDKKYLSNISQLKGWHLHSVYGEREKCDDCEGKLVFNYGKHAWGKSYEVCDSCSSGHRKLKSLGIETSINTWAD